MAVEIVVLIPVLFMFTLFVVAGGRYVSARADADSTARDAARAASQAHTRGEAARRRTRPPSRRACAPPATASRPACPATSSPAAPRSSGSTAGAATGTSGLLGIPGSIAVDAEGHAPIDTYRSTR